MEILVLFILVIVIGYIFFQQFKSRFQLEVIVSNLPFFINLTTKKMTVNSFTDKKVQVTFKYRDRLGAPAKVENFEAQSSNPDLATVENIVVSDFSDPNFPNDLGTQVTFDCPCLQVGVPSIDTSADGDLGAGVVEIPFNFEIDIMDAQASNVVPEFNVVDR